MMDNLMNLINESFYKKDFILSVNMIGSSLHRDIRGCREIDFYIIVDKMCPHKLQEIKNIFGQLDRLFKSVYLELRRGPFKAIEAKQLHLIIEDKKTIYETSPITLADWTLNSQNIFGMTIREIVPLREKKVLILSFEKEIYKVLRMLSTAMIDYKEWLYEGDFFRLHERTKRIDSVRDYCVLLRHCYRAMKNDFLALSDIPSLEDKIISDVEVDIKNIAVEHRYSTQIRTGLLKNRVAYFLETLLNFTNTMKTKTLLKP